jgi:acetolactate synthase-1/2/3 large subunit
MVTGGGAMHLNDAFGREPRLQVVPVHHEQTAAMAAESYARFGGAPAIVNVTTGPGGVNALNGVFGAYTDSVPMIVVSGQVKRETMLTSYDLPLRQLGDQEVDIVRMVSGITKYAVELREPTDVRRALEEACHLAVSGRPGPVWLDIPGDVQGALVNPEDLIGYVPARLPVPPSLPQPVRAEEMGDAAREVLQHLAKAERPVIFAGGGVRASNAYGSFRRCIERLGVPVVTAWNAHDLLPNDHPLFAGRPGTLGDRAGNFAVQNADCILVLGSRLNIRQISYNWQSFARFAHLMMVDADPAELAKPTLRIDRKICATLQEFLPALEREAGSYKHCLRHEEYLSWCRERVARYPVVLGEYWLNETPVNPYCFVESLFDQLKEDDTIVTADGTACVVTFQAAKIKEGQRLYTNSGSASMGYDLPAAIGATLAGGADRNGRLICLAGDGSIMMNLQELATIVGRRLPIKIFLFNNDGYHSIRQSQQAYFPDNVVGCGPDSSLPFPDFVEVARAFGFAARRVDSHGDLQAAIEETLLSSGPQFCEVILDKRQVFAPRLSSRRLDDGTMVSSPLEDLAPFLPRAELAENMIAQS